MKTSWTLAVLPLLVLLSSCEVVEGIFKAGMGFGIFIVVLIIGIIAWLVMRGRKNT